MMIGRGAYGRPWWPGIIANSWMQTPAWMNPPFIRRQNSSSIKAHVDLYGPELATELRARLWLDDRPPSRPPVWFTRNGGPLASAHSDPA